MPMAMAWAALIASRALFGKLVNIHSSILNIVHCAHKAFKKPVHALKKINYNCAANNRQFKCAAKYGQACEPARYRHRGMSFCREDWNQNHPRSTSSSSWLGLMPVSSQIHPRPGASDCIGKLEFYSSCSYLTPCLCVMGRHTYQARKALKVEVSASFSQSSRRARLRRNLDHGLDKQVPRLLKSPCPLPFSRNLRPELVPAGTFQFHFAFQSFYRHFCAQNRFPGANPEFGLQVVPFHLELLVGKVTDDKERSPGWPPLGMDRPGRKAGASRRP